MGLVCVSCIFQHKFLVPFRLIIKIFDAQVLCEFSRKCFKTTEKYSLAVRCSLWGEKQFLLILVPFYWFVQKQLFKQIQTFLRICTFSNMLRKTNFLSISVLLSDKVTF